MKRKNVILSLVASISVLILVVGLFAVKQFMQWRMLLNSGVFSAAHKDIMEGLLGHISNMFLKIIYRSEERRVRKECRIGCRSRWSPYH